MVDQAPPLKVAVVGVGHFGTFHCEKIAALPEARLEAVVDVDMRKARSVAERFKTTALDSVGELAGRVDAAVVAVPSKKHHMVASALLADGIDLLVEKPLATSLADARELCYLAQSINSMIQVGHLERFNPILPRALDDIRGPRFVKMNRLGPFPGRGADMNVVYELMIHDLDILKQLTSSKLIGVWAKGWKVVTDCEDMVVARLDFEDGLVAELNASRISSEQVRNFSVLDSRGVLDVDLMARRMSRSSFTDGKQVIERADSLEADPLLEQDRAFVQVAMNGKKPLVSGQAAIGAVALAETIVSALKEHT